MAILIDPPAWPAHGTVWSHLVSDQAYAELHAFAHRMGTPRRGFDLDHYDVPAASYERAIALGALPVSGKELVQRLRASGLRVRQADRDIVAPVRRREYLRSEWNALLPHVDTASGPVSLERWEALGDELLTRWNEPHRTYHDERHLEDVLLALNHFEVSGEPVDVSTKLAAWFHDAVYAGVTGSDEAASAALARSALTDVGDTAFLAETVAEFVVNTTPGQDLEVVPDALAQLLDADLAIFGAAPARYDRYARAVREEYAHVPDIEFARARARILRGYLEQAELYRGATARMLWDARARLNLEREIALLEQH